MYSGGKDSGVTAKYLERHDKLLGCVALDTGISTPDWREFIESECDRHGWPLRVYKTTGSYDDMVLKYGFPGPAHHQVAMSTLKWRALRVLKKDLGANTNLASGARKLESDRRGRTAKLCRKFEGLMIWNPIVDWTTEDTWAYFTQYGLRKAPGYSTLAISGDCLCGAFARPDELDIISRAYPCVYQRLQDLERLAARHGHRAKWGWGSTWKRPKKTQVELITCAECGE